MAKSKTVTKFRGRGKSGKRSRLTDAKAIAVIERRYRVVGLRRDGYTHKEIAEELNISPQTVSQDLKMILTETIIKTEETVEEDRALATARLDKITKAFMPLATEEHYETAVDPVTGKKIAVLVPPDPKFANVILAAETRRAKLRGTDKPELKQLEVSGVRIYEGVDLDQV